VAEKDGHPIAFYTLQQKDGNAWIENLWVAPEFIGKGVGKRLFLQAVALSRRRGYETLQLEADPMLLVFVRRWVCSRSANDIPRWRVSPASCQSWK